MNIPISWLKDYVKIDCSLKGFVDRMTITGSKVERIERLGHDITGVVIGKVLSVDKHPNADKLVITKIDTGAGEPLQIVTGATNLYPGAVVPVALDGAALANGLKIKKGKLRGEVSDGMLCSVEEMGYTRNDYPEAPEDGIYIFLEQDGLELGTDALDVLQMRDEVVEFEITSNRSDCFSVVGLAREAAAAFDKTLEYPSLSVEEKAGGSANEMISVEINNAALCPRYIARVVKNVKIGPSPLWLRRRLSASGIRPINNIVDITNFVMHEMGQPMHAFDIDCISERKIIVRNAVEGEVFTTLDGTERKLDPSMLVIADCEKAVAVAGVMGGENSKITENASAILFESANFNGTNIRHTSKKLGLRTDSSTKYEKGLDPNLAEAAVNRAAHLVELLGCGEVVRGMVDCYPSPRTERTVLYNPEKINARLGTDITAQEMESILQGLEIRAKNGTAQIPTFRPDIEAEADIAEEVARIFGYDRIESTLTSGTPTVGKKTLKQSVEDIIKDVMVAQGFCEILTYAFESPKVLDKLKIGADSPLRKNIAIINPLGEDYSIMRTTTAGSMLSSLSTNYNRRNDEALLFELAKIYVPRTLPMEELPEERAVLTVGMYGKNDFYRLKGVVEELLEKLGINEADFIPADDIPFMHPGRCAVLRLDGTELGYMGEIHQEVADNYGIGTRAYTAVIYADILFARANRKRIYSPVAKFPSVKRDIAVIVRDEILVKELERAITQSGGKLIESVKLFDVYKGQNVGDGFKSVAYGITFRAADRTLTDSEASAAVNKIIARLESEFDAKIRDK